MVLSIAHQDIAVGHDCNSFESLEFAVIRTPAAESSQKAAIGMEDLNTVVARISDTNVPLIIDGHATRELELSLKERKGFIKIMSSHLTPIPHLFASLAAEGIQHLSVDVKDLHPMVVRIGDNDAVGVAHGNVMRVLKLPFPTP